MSIFLALMALANEDEGTCWSTQFVLNALKPVELESFIIILFTTKRFVVFLINIIAKSKINLIAISTYTAPHETPWFLRQLTLSQGSALCYALGFCHYHQHCELPLFPANCPLLMHNVTNVFLILNSFFPMIFLRCT